MDKFKDKIEKVSLFFIIYTIVFLIFFETLRYTLPFVLALIISLLLKYPTRFLMNKFKMKPWLASLLSTIIFFAILISLTILIVIALSSEVINLSKYLQSTLSQNSTFFYNNLTNFEQTLSNLNIAIDPTVLSYLQSNITSSLSTITSSLLSFTSLLLQGLLKILSYIPYIGMVIVFTLLSTYFFTKEISIKASKNFVERNIPSSTKILNILYHSKKMILTYLLTSLSLIILSCLLTFIGFNILGVEYSLVLSLLCGLFDLLPVIGMPLIYFPLAFYYMTTGNYFTGTAIIILYVIVFITRQFLEPKVMSSSLGINPVAALAALFIGLQAGGLLGMIFCMFLVISYNILKKLDII